MSSYVLIETRDPFDSADCERFWELAEGLADQQHDVTVYFAQNAVLAARRATTREQAVIRLASHATVLADDFSLRERAIGDDELADGVRVGTMDRLVDLAVDGRKILWH
ncbi:MAG: DsrE family protein [Acidimicrobiales bacterium]